MCVDGAAVLVRLVVAVQDGVGRGLVGGEGVQVDGEFGEGSGIRAEAGYPFGGGTESVECARGEVQVARHTIDATGGPWGPLCVCCGCQENAWWPVRGPYVVDGSARGGV